MPPTDHLLAFALLAFVLIIVPGPNVIFVITRSLMLGRVAGVSTAVAGQIGVYAQVTRGGSWHRGTGGTLGDPVHRGQARWRRLPWSTSASKR